MMKNTILLTIPLLAMSIVCTSFSSKADPIYSVKNSNLLITSNSPEVQKVTAITGSDMTKTVSMDGGILLITGSDNKILVEGFVSKIVMMGSDNTVKANILNSVEITGSDNTITYKTSKNKSKKASVASTGSDNSVNKM